ncbi:hypothetical protein THAOC_18005 [Thalassiosira oceanica]|uniref:Uncharacterized protein n=1 Tax=Thalassiosira oceanica TaxID=159749 RepID=K0S5U1_THAOC|nr:hypothetical protein THAOC_18005 [Thalassiosira oceanica]|eukprot:EJK61498.1 hypothetical protein THAOC_18005 [Thalassiosira oceanica]
MAPLGRGELLLNHEPPSNGGWQHQKFESRLIDEVIPAAALSDLQIRTRTGGQTTEVPPSPTATALHKGCIGVGAMGVVIGPPGEAIEELDSPYHRCANRARQAAPSPVIPVNFMSFDTAIFCLWSEMSRLPVSTAAHANSSLCSSVMESTITLSGQVRKEVLNKKSEFQNSR